MPKIKNWSKADGKLGKGIVADWQHDSGNAGVSIERRTLGGSVAEYDIVYMWDKKDGSIGRRKLNVAMDTQESARTFAVNWMKRHPSPKGTN